MFERFKDEKHNEWAKEAKDRLGHHCMICFRVNAGLHTHHMDSYDVNPDKRYLKSNAAILCVDHHELFHLIFGKGNNTRQQFIQFITTIRILEELTRKLINSAPIAPDIVLSRHQEKDYYDDDIK